MEGSGRRIHAVRYCLGGGISGVCGVFDMSVQDWIIIAAGGCRDCRNSSLPGEEKEKRKMYRLFGEGCGHCPYADRKRNKTE